MSFLCVNTTLYALRWRLYAAYLSKEAANVLLIRATAGFSVMAALNGVLGIVARRMKENYHNRAQQDPNTSKLPEDIPEIDNQE